MFGSYQDRQTSQFPVCCLQSRADHPDSFLRKGVHWCSLTKTCLEHLQLRRWGSRWAASLLNKEYVCRPRHYLNKLTGLKAPLTSIHQSFGDYNMMSSKNYLSYLISIFQSHKPLLCRLAPLRILTFKLMRSLVIFLLSHRRRIADD